MNTQIVEYLRLPRPKYETEILPVEEDPHSGNILSAVVVTHSPKETIVFPVVEGILCLLPPWYIVDSDQQRLIGSLFANLRLKRPDLEEAISNFLYRMRASFQDIKRQEVAYYEQKYKAIYESNDFEVPMFGDAWYNSVRDVLTPMFRGSIVGKRILEIGGGDFRTLLSFLPPSVHQYTFVGTEVSFWGLRCGARRNPSGQFIQCDSDSLPFLPRVFDYVFAKGTIHHQAKKEATLTDLMNVLRPSGILGFSETVASHRRPRFVNRIMKALRLLIEPDSVTSPMDDHIDRERALAIVRSLGKVISLKERSSIVRYLLVRLLARWKVRSKTLSKFIVTVDDLVNTLFPFSKIWLLRRHSMHVVVQKEPEDLPR